MLDFEHLMKYNLIMGVLEKYYFFHHSHYLKYTTKSLAKSIGNPDFYGRAVIDTNL